MSRPPSRLGPPDLGERVHDLRHLCTRLRGLDKEQNKELLVQHLRGAAESGCPKSELQEVLPGLSWGQINRLLTELRQEGRVRMVGSRRWSRWLSA